MDEHILKDIHMLKLNILGCHRNKIQSYSISHSNGKKGKKRKTNLPWGASRREEPGWAPHVDLRREGPRVEGRTERPASRGGGLSQGESSARRWRGGRHGAGRGGAWLWCCSAYRGGCTRHNSRRRTVAAHGARVEAARGGRGAAWEGHGRSIGTGRVPRRRRPLRGRGLAGRSAAMEEGRHGNLKKMTAALEILAA
jgi:hypothetical protein